MASERVCAVVVTFNRKALLSECLRGLSRQTRPVDHILVVDNAGTDGTAEHVAARHPGVQCLSLKENLGGAGGFHTGVAWAFQNGFDWIWMMDDDVEPAPDTLEVMLGYRHISDFIHVREEALSGEPMRWEGIWDLSALDKRGLTEDLSFKNGKPWMSVNYSCFEGGLIHRKVVERIGPPDKNFFIWGDDTIYGLLASFHTNVICINHVGFKKKLPHEPPITPQKLYFFVRNKFLIYRHLKAVGAPLSRVVSVAGVGLVLLWLVRKHVECRTWQTLRYVLLALRDGRRGRFGPPPWVKA